MDAPDVVTTMRYAHIEAHDLKGDSARLETFVSSQAPEEPPPEPPGRDLQAAASRPPPAG